MSLKKIIFLISVFIALLLPAADLLKNQNPWSCFNFTLDESFFAQASQNWSEGKGYRMSDSPPFDPNITAGVPMAWGTTAVSRIANEDIAHSGRMFIYFCFFALLVTLARTSYERDRNWLAVPLGVWIFTYGLSKIPFGGYFVFGFLGEGLAFFIGALLYRILDKKMFLIAGVLSVFIFIIKPTFLFLIPAVGLTAVLVSMRSAIFAGLGIGVTLLANTFWIASERGETVLGYLDGFLKASTRIAQDTAPGTLLAYYSGKEMIPLFLSGLFLFIGGAGFLFRRRKAPTSQITAFLFFIISVAYFLILGKTPVGKQWSAILVFTLIGFAPYWGALIARRFAGWFPKETLATATIAIMATWTLAVSQNAHHEFKRKKETDCPSKEQSAINRELRTLTEQGKATAENTQVLREFYPYTMMIYKAGFNPPYIEKRSEIKEKSLKWLVGETKLLYPEPKGCENYWRGSTFSMLKCQ